MLRLEDSMRLAVIHSPAYQQQLETLYLSSLDVSTERFRLQTQFFAGNATTYNGRGSLAGVNPRGEWAIRASRERRVYRLAEELAERAFRLVPGPL